MIFQLLKIHLKNLYTPGIFLEGFKKGIKSIIKNILILLLMLYGIGACIYLMIATALASADTLASVEKLYLMPSVAAIISIVSILLFGITSVASNYYTGNGEEQFLAMPLSNLEIFGAKFGLSCITDAVFGIVIFSILSIVYGIKQGLMTNPLFYIGLIVISFSFSLFVIALVYTLLILILLAFPGLRKRSFLTGIATVILFAFIIVYAYFGGIAGGSVAEAMEANGGNGSFFFPLALRLAALAEKMPFFVFLSGALDGKLLPVLLLLLISALIILLLIPLLAKLYGKTLAGFSDVKSKKLSSAKASQLIEKDSRVNTAFKALFIRDIRLVFREPVFFTNGPLMAILFPVLVITSALFSFILTSDASISDLLSQIKNQYIILSEQPEKVNKILYYICLAVSGLAFFSGTSASVAATAFSREGKSLSNLKAMPVTFETILKAKFWHSLLYVFFDSALFTIILLIVNQLLDGLVPWLTLCKMLIFSIILTIAASLPLIFLDLILDAANPKLAWENPTAAVKQNFNTMFAMLFSMLIIGIFVGLGILLPKRINSLIYISALFVLIGAPLGSLYFRYGSKRLKVM